MLSEAAYAALPYRRNVGVALSGPGGRSLLSISGSRLVRPVSTEMPVWQQAYRRLVADRTSSFIIGPICNATSRCRNRPGQSVKDEGYCC